MSTGKAGSTVKDQLMSVWRQTGVKPKELDDVVTLPECCYGVWKAFIDLNNARSSSGFGVNPVSYLEIQAYCNLYNTVLDEWELDLIRKFDNVVLQIHADQAEKQSKKKPS